jgi:hypothetical protein
METSMEEKLAKLRAALQDLKKASMFRKALAAEAAIVAAVALIEDMIEEIEKLKRDKQDVAK